MRAGGEYADDVADVGSDRRRGAFAQTHLARVLRGEAEPVVVRPRWWVIQWGRCGAGCVVSPAAPSGCGSCSPRCWWAWGRFGATGCDGVGVRGRGRRWHRRVEGGSVALAGCRHAAGLGASRRGDLVDVRGRVHHQVPQRRGRCTSPAPAGRTRDALRGNLDRSHPHSGEARMADPRTPGTVERPFDDVRRGDAAGDTGTRAVEALR